MNIRNGLEMITSETYGFIYMTHNMVNGKKYIGQKRIHSRPSWKSYLGSGTILHRAVKAYGAKNFYKDILDVAYNENELNSKEIEWIQKYDAVNNPVFYNLDCGGYAEGYATENYDDNAKRLAFENKSKRSKEYQDVVRGHWANAHLKEEEVIEIVKRLQVGETIPNILLDYPHVSYGTIENIRLHKTWKHITEGIDFPNMKDILRIMQSRTIIQYDLFGKYINKYENAKVAAKEIGKGDHTNISHAARTKYATAFGYIWVREDNDWVSDIIYNTDYLSYDIPIIKYAEKVGLKTTGLKLRSVLQYDLDGAFIKQYDSAREASEHTNVKIRSIHAACETESGIMCGFIWRYGNKGGDEVSGSTE